MDASSARLYRLGDVEVDTHSGCVRRGGAEESVRQKPYQVLLFFLRNRGRLVSKDELMAVLWPGVVVTEDAVVQAIVEVRRLLGDDPRSPRFIRTIPRLGYRFVGEVVEEEVVVEEVTSLRVEVEEERVVFARGSPPGPSAGTDRRRRAHFAAAAIGLAAGLALAGFGAARLVDRRAPELTLAPSQGKTGVVVLFFENASATAELTWLKQGLADMLISELSARPGLSVLGRPHLAELLARKGGPEGPIELRGALEVARRANAQRVVTGTFESIGRRLRVDAQVLDAASGRLLGAESLTVEAPEELLARVDLLAHRLASRLGAAPRREAPPTLARTMTASLPAYQAYSVALERGQALHAKDAVSLLEKAIALDPGFAMAYARLGWVYGLVWGDAPRARPFLEKAWALSERLNELDRLRVSAWYAIACSDFDGAVARYRALLAEDPNDVESMDRLGVLLHGEERYEEAWSVLQRARALDPASADVANHLSSLALSMRRKGEALAMAERYVALAPAEPNAHDTLGGTLAAVGRNADALEEFRRAVALDPAFEIARVHEGNALVALGRYREAEESYRAYLSVAPSRLEEARAHTCLAALARRRGDVEAARAAALTAWGIEPAFFHEALYAALETGDRRLVTRLAPRVSETPRYNNRGARLSLREAEYAAGRLALDEGRIEDALRRFRAALAHRPLFWAIEPREDALAEALVSLGRWSEAKVELEHLLAWNPDDARARYRLGLTLEALGDREGARRELGRFLELWSAADPGLPEVVDARRRLVRYVEDGPRIISKLSTSSRARSLRVA